jgi:hypothetical protein
MSILEKCGLTAGQVSALTENCRQPPCPIKKRTYLSQKKAQSEYYYRHRAAILARQRKAYRRKHPTIQRKWGRENKSDK